MPFSASAPAAGPLAPGAPRMAALAVGTATAPLDGSRRRPHDGDHAAPDRTRRHGTGRLRPLIPRASPCRPGLPRPGPDRTRGDRLSVTDPVRVRGWP